MFLKQLCPIALTAMLVFFACPTIAVAQDSGGLLPEDPAAMDTVGFADFTSHRDKPLPKSYNLFDVLSIESSKLSCLNFPIDQGGCSSCAGCAIAHACSIHHAIRLKNCEGELRWVDFSGSFIYNQVKPPGDCQTGSRIGDGLSLVAQQGICTTKDFANSRYNCKKLPDARQLNAAFHFKIKSFQKIVTPKISANRDTVIEQIKRALLNNNPVIVSAKIPNSLAELPEGDCLWKASKEKFTIAHALVVVAYDGNYFEVLNSLGCGWGCDGFAKIPCMDLAAMAQWAFIMNPLPCD